MKNICVYCGSKTGSNPAYKQNAIELGKTLAHKNIGLIYGGGKIGLMGILADTVLQHGGKVIGIIPDFLNKREVAHQNVSQLFIVKTMHERKQRIADLADGFIAMPGGLGTLDEFFEIVTWAQLGLHSKPCGILNTNGYFDSIKHFLLHSVKEQFIQKEFIEMIIIEHDPKTLIDKFFFYQHPEINKIFDFNP